MANSVRFKADLDDKVSSKLDKIRDQFNQIGGKGTSASLFGNIGAKAAGAALAVVGQAAHAMTGLVGDSIQGASNLNETLAKSSVVFGENAGDIESWGNTAAKTFGTSKNASIAAAASFADLFNTVGLGKVPARDMSTSLVELAADLASFHNVAGGSPEVLEKLRAGLSGEAEPMRRLGVFLSEAKVKAKAMEMGLGDAHGELTDGEKIIARYNIILDETATAQGDFARTSDALANKQRTANAVMEDYQATLGEKMLPAQLAVTTAQIDMFTGLNALADAIGGKMTPESIALTVALGGMTEAEAAAEIASRRTAAAAAEAATAYTRYESKRGLWIKASKDIAETLPDELDAAKTKAVKIVSRTTSDIADALREKRTIWQDAVDQLKDDVESRMTRTAEIAKLKAELAGTNISKGLKSKDPIVRKQARATAQIIAGRLSELGAKAETWGNNVGARYAKGIREKQAAVITAAALLASITADYLQTKSPAKKGPLSEGGGPEGWSRRFVDLYAKGMDHPGVIERKASALAGAARFAVAGSGGAARGAGGASVTLVYSPTYSTASVAEARTFASAILPELVREMNRQRV